MSERLKADLPKLYFDQDPPKCLEGRDFVVRPDGAYVFTTEYLLARGTCCGSKCLHCPFENKRAKSPTIDTAPMEPSVTPTSESTRRLEQRPVISMVPSWTETLIACGVNVQGRTRFCIHPQDLVRHVRVFGGTKTLAEDASEKMAQVLTQTSMASGSQISHQKPLVILDREENPKSFFDFFSKFDCEVLVTHVTNGESFVRDLSLLARAFSDTLSEALRPASQSDSISSKLRALGARWMAAQRPKTSMTQNLNANSRKESLVRERFIEDLILETECPILYVIWRNPWMVVRHDTWIGEMLRAKFSKAKFPVDGKRLFVGAADSRYPEIIASEVPHGAVILFSSEPYPFGRSDDLPASDLALNSRALAVVNGEAFSWFGLRALRFLEES